MAKKSMKNCEKQHSIHQQEVKEMESELEDVKKLWTEYEEKAQAELSSRGHSMELEESQVNNECDLPVLIYILYSLYQ